MAISANKSLKIIFVNKKVLYMNDIQIREELNSWVAILFFNTLRQSGSFLSIGIF